MRSVWLTAGVSAGGDDDRRRVIRQQVDRPAQLRECFEMLTRRSARLMNLKDYGFAVGHPADVVIIDAQTGEQAVAEIAQPLAAFKRGRQTVAWERPALIRPD